MSRSIDSSAISHRDAKQLVSHRIDCFFTNWVSITIRPHGPRTARKLAKLLHQFSPHHFPLSCGFQFLVNRAPMCVERLALNENMENFICFCFANAKYFFDNVSQIDLAAPKSQHPSRTSRFCDSGSCGTARSNNRL